MQALKCFSVLAYENTQVSMTLVNGEEVSSRLFSSLLVSSRLFSSLLVSSHLVSSLLVLSVLMNLFFHPQCWWMGSCSLRYLSE